MVMITAARTSRAIPIMPVWATCRVPLGLSPVPAAIAVTITARTSHPIEAHAPRFNQPEVGVIVCQPAVETQAPAVRRWGHGKKRPTRSIAR